MISQIKLGILHPQTSCNKQQTQSSKMSDPFSSATEYNWMTGYDAFDTTGDLEDFEEGVFGFEEDPLPSWKPYLTLTFWNNTLQAMRQIFMIGSILIMMRENGIQPKLSPKKENHNKYCANVIQSLQSTILYPSSRSPSPASNTNTLCSHSTSQDHLESDLDSPINLGSNLSIHSDSDSNSEKSSDEQNSQDSNQSQHDQIISNTHANSSSITPIDFLQKSH
ncbi:hypothetical protein O181_049215 [Austropuccinia psidii MF-1]|uniref:Uncharacterized protein n=1 Tax=Austropuccinia psidii MF-1 TaxID=1389203 RepID=A0A9Q3HPV0_9BASI|nr:hypothetical protein [Austropuccinia psidii MF-1]